MKFAAVLVVVLSLFLVSCNRNRDFEAGNDSVSKVMIDDTGDIWLNSRPTSLALLNDEFTRLKKLNGVVWYYQASPSQAANASGANQSVRVPVTGEDVREQRPVQKSF